MRHKLRRLPSRAVMAVAAITCAGLFSVAGPGIPEAFAAPPPGAWSAANLQSAYGLSSATQGWGQTVAVVTAYHDPTAESDLTGYRSQEGLPACTTANGCFQSLDLS